MSNKNLKVVFFGTSDFVAGVFALLLQKYDLVAVVTSPDKAIGRHQTLTPSYIKTLAIKNNIPVFTPDKLNTEFAQTLMKSQPDLIVVASYGKIIPSEILDIPRLGAI